MATDANALRRRAALATFADVLPEEALREALALQQEALRSDAVSDIIKYVDAVSRRNLLDAATSKRMYTRLYAALREPEDRLPPDLPPVLAPVIAAAPAQAPQPVAATPPAVEPLPAPVSVTAEAAAPAIAPADTVQPAPSVASVLPGEPPAVFGAVLRALVAELRSFHADALAEVGKDASREVQRSDVSPELRQRFQVAWRRPLDDDWRLQGISLELAELVRVVFVALTQAFGRNGADQILGRAIVAAERTPEAVRFSPRRLLATL